MKIHWCTILSCMGEALFGIQVLDEILHELPIWVEELIKGNMDD